MTSSVAELVCILLATATLLFSTACRPSSLDPEVNNDALLPAGSPTPLVDCTSLPPEAEILQPAADSVFKPPADVLLRGKISDREQSDSRKLTIRWIVRKQLAGEDPAPISIDVEADEDGAVEASVEDLPEASYEALLHVTDVCGEESETTVPFEVFDQPPSIELYEISQESTTNAQPVDFKGSALDPDDSSESLEITVFDNLESRDEISTSPNESGEWSLSLAFSSVGTHRLYFIVTDPAGNVTYTDETRIEVVFYIPLP